MTLLITLVFLDLSSQAHSVSTASGAQFHGQAVAKKLIPWLNDPPDASAGRNRVKELLNHIGGLQGENPVIFMGKWSASKKAVVGTATSHFFCRLPIISRPVRHIGSCAEEHKICAWLVYRI